MKIELPVKSWAEMVADARQTLGYDLYDLEDETVARLNGYLAVHYGITLWTWDKDNLVTAEFDDENQAMTFLLQWV